MSGPDVCQQPTKGSDDDSDRNRNAWKEQNRCATELKCTNMMPTEEMDIMLEAIQEISKENPGSLFKETIRNEQLVPEQDTLRR